MIEKCNCWAAVTQSTFGQFILLHSRTEFCFVHTKFLPMYFRYTFSSNHYDHKSSYGFCFWATLWLIDFTTINQVLKPKNKGRMNSFERCALTKKFKYIECTNLQMESLQSLQSMHNSMTRKNLHYYIKLSLSKSMHK